MVIPSAKQFLIVISLPLSFPSLSHRMIFIDTVALPYPFCTFQRYKLVCSHRQPIASSTKRCVVRAAIW